MVTVRTDSAAPVIATRTFTWEDQRSFARLSGDFNPLHVDPIAARRLLFGEVVVHGVHTLLWALDALFAAQEDAVTLRRVHARFPAPVRLGEEVGVSIDRREQGAARLAVRSAGRACVAIDVALAPVRGAVETGGHNLAPPAEGTPRDLDFEQASRAEGVVPLCMDAVLLGGLLPAVAKGLSAGQASILLAATRLVGMECPGLHSLFSELKLDFDGKAHDAGALRYRVSLADERFGLIRMTVSGPGVSGELATFHRPAPVVQAGMAEVRQVVTPGEFAAQRALVVGGSRGLGEVTARIIAAGGGSVRITYHRGEHDAESVARSIRAAGGRCEPFSLDVLVDPPQLRGIVTDDWRPTHLYYFAGPRIHLGTEASGVVEQRSYARFFVEGFERIVRETRKLTSGPLSVFFPSTVFIDQPVKGANAYRVAKLEGEAVCRELKRSEGELTCHIRRLPRLRTDQTVTLMASDVAEPLPMVLATLREIGR